jgi:hypothetical protein
MGKAHGLDDQMKFPGFGWIDANRENKDLPKRVRVFFYRRPVCLR